MSAAFDTSEAIADAGHMTPQEIHTSWITRSGRVGGDAKTNARFPYWSFTKTAIAVCALKLVEIGRLNLEMQPAAHPVSLRDLLGHTSGLPDYGTLKSYHAAVERGDTPWSRERVTKAALAQGMKFPPGKGWSYSNVGYLLVREMIEEVTASPLGDVISDVICAPLGLDDVRFWDTTAQSAALHWTAAAEYDPGWVYHGSLEGRAEDAARVLHAVFTSDLLKPQTRALMMQRYPLGGAIPGRPWLTCGYGLGLMSGTVAGAGRAIGHSGAGPFCVNAVYHFPDLPDPMTVAAFTDGTDEGVAEVAAIAAACA